MPTLKIGLIGERVALVIREIQRSKSNEMSILVGFEVQMFSLNSPSIELTAFDSNEDNAVTNNPRQIIS